MHRLPHPILSPPAKLVCKIPIQLYTVGGHVQLTKHTDYGLRVLFYLAIQSKPRVSTEEIAAVFGIARNHLSKVVAKLAGNGIVESARGKGGGIRLRSAPKEICVGDVVRLLEGETFLVNCNRPLCPVLPACRLRQVMQEAQRACFAVFDSYSLHDLTSGRGEALRTLLNVSVPANGTGA